LRAGDAGPASARLVKYGLMMALGGVTMWYFGFDGAGFVGSGLAVAAVATILWVVETRKVTAAEKREKP
jgi:hypothetical protein